MKSKTLKHLFLSVLLLTAASSVGCSGHNAADEDKPKLYTVGEELHLTRVEAYAAISVDVKTSELFDRFALLRGSLKNVQFLGEKVQEVDIRGASWYEINTTVSECKARSAEFGNLQFNNAVEFSIEFEDTTNGQASCKGAVLALVGPVRIKIGPTPITLTDGRKAIADSFILYLNYRDSDLQM